MNLYLVMFYNVTLTVTSYLQQVFISIRHVSQRMLRAVRNFSEIYATLRTLQGSSFLFAPKQLWAQLARLEAVLRHSMRSLIVVAASLAHATICDS